MNYNKAQKEVFSALIRGDRVCGYKYDDEHFFVTTDGYMGWIFPIKEIFFNTEKIQNIKPLELAGVVSPDNELKLTLDFRAENFTRGRMFRRLEGPGKSVFVNDRFLACFQNARFYQKQDEPHSSITVTERLNPRGKDIPVGVILPIKIFDPKRFEA